MMKKELTDEELEELEMIKNGVFIVDTKVDDEDDLTFVVEDNGIEEK